ncbi:MAG: hypothetical protein ABSH38_11430 [Verrucomicrobiota bacterium]|jgi:hypothetical protein
MTQKQALARILEFAQRNITVDSNNAIAARAAFVILWLEDMNWHSEARALADRTLATPRLKAASEKLEQDDKRTGQLQDAVALFNWLFGWGLNTDEWRATQGSTLVEELWNIITALP